MGNPLTVRAAVLQVLLGGSAYGAELIDRFARRTAGHCRLAPGRVYPVLKGLESDGLVEVVRVAPRGRRGARTRLYYVLTPKGRAEAVAEREVLLRLLTPLVIEPMNERLRALMSERLQEADTLSEAASEMARAGR